jgi:hypothetical protein
MNMRSRIERVAQEARAATGATRKEPSRGNSRKSDRHRLVEEKVRVTHEGQTHEAELINVSGGGAMIAASFGASEWDKLELHLGENGTIECAVRWVKEGRLGLEFAHETQLDFSAEQQAILLREVISRTYSEAHFSQAAAAPKPASAEADDEQTQRAKRHPLIWSGTLHCNGQRTPIRVRNISATGAMVQCSEVVPNGAEAMLELSETVSVHGTIGWVVGDQVGLRFHGHFDVTQLARSTPQIAPQRWERPAYLNKAAETASPWDPRWQRISMREMGDELEGFLKR